MDFLIQIGICLIGLINPNFTPIHLTNQSNVVIEMNLSLSDGKDVNVNVVKIWKGKSNKTIKLTLSTAAVVDQKNDFVQTLKNRKSVQSLLFVGGEKGDASTALLHIEGTWYNFEFNDQTWGLTTINSDMSTTWDGGTDMLVKAVDYILSSESPELPVVEGASWVDLSAGEDPEPFAQLGESVHAAQAVYINDMHVLHVSSTDGDRLFAYDADSDSMRDVTKKHKLSAASQISAWLDVNVDGKLDLITWNDRLQVYAQSSVGFVEQKLPASQQAVKSCHSLSPLGNTGKIIIATDDGPMIWSLSGHTIKPIASLPKDIDLGKAGLCIVADFNNDNHVDVLQLYRKKALVYEGTGSVNFKAPVVAKIAQGDDEFNAFLGDFDADGLLDFFTVGPNQKTALWNNRGAFAFKNEFEMTGEMTAKGPEDAISGVACDFNNDGRQDVIFFYDMDSPRILFSRGFRSFGLANGMDMSANGLLEESLEGAQAGCVADFNGDGCQDMVVIHVSGNAHFLPISNGEDTVGCVHLALDKNLPGPIRVNAWQDDRCLGAHNVGSGNQEAFIGQSEAGPMLLKWQLPNGTKKELEVIVENEPQRVVLK